MPYLPDWTDDSATRSYLDKSLMFSDKFEEPAEEKETWRDWLKLPEEKTDAGR